MAAISDAQLMHKMMLFARKSRVGRGGPRAAGFGMSPHGPHGPHHHGPCGGGPHHHRHGRVRELLLVTIAGHEGGIRQKELARIAGINASSTSEVVSKLEADGYVRREVDPTDRRATLIVLTELGEARAAEVEDEQAERLGNIFAPLTTEEKERLSALLDKLLAATDEEG